MEEMERLLPNEALSSGCPSSPSMKIVEASALPANIRLLATAQIRIPSATKEATKLVANKIPSIGVITYSTDVVGGLRPARSGDQVDSCHE